MENTKYLYIYSENVEYIADPMDTYNKFDIKVPADTLILPHTNANIDMDATITMWDINVGRIYGLHLIPTEAILDTPLVPLLIGKSISTPDAPTALHLHVRNDSDSNYTVLAGTVLFQLVLGNYENFNIIVTDSLEYIPLQ
jgi:hypothetical protein